MITVWAGSRTSGSPRGSVGGRYGSFANGDRHQCGYAPAPRRDERDRALGRGLVDDLGQLGANVPRAQLLRFMCHEGSVHGRSQVYIGVHKSGSIRPLLDVPNQEPPLAVSKRLRAEIFRRDNSTCRYCGAKAPAVEITIDHVVPVTLGGSDDPSNLVTACADCNNGKTSVPPNAAIVKQVSEDAFRWARAIEAAAEKTLSGRETARAAFDQKWRAWSEGRPVIPRPEGWGLSVDQFVRAGLPLPMLLDCVDVAMRARHVKADAVFKYMCGVAWKEVNKLQQAARSALVEGPVEVAPAPDSESGEFRAGRFDAAHDLLANLHDNEQEHYREHARKFSEFPEDEVECEVDAAQTAFTDAREERDRLHDALLELLTLHPADSVASWRESALDEVKAHMGEDFTEYDVLVHTVRLAKQERDFEESRSYLDQLSPEEKAEWIACATALLGYNDDPQHLMHIEVKAADYAQKNKANRTVFGGLCTSRGDHGAMCPGLSAYVMRLEACVGCGEECLTHIVCERHLELFVDGQIISSSTGLPHVVTDFKAIEPPEVDEPPF